MSTYSITSRQESRVEVNMQKIGYGEGFSSEENWGFIDERPDL
ncbi:hypothetical protein [Klebsiella quasipneumoniae]|nr:hypothetical protein [Klebsiella quasipneumoniae]